MAKRAKVAATEGPEYFCRWPMLYAGKQLSWGQIFKRVDAPNNAQLIRLGYMVEFNPREYDRVVCPTCGAEFTGHNAKIDHVRAEHSQMTEEQQDNHADSMESKLKQMSPLYLDQTLAARGA